MRSLRKFRVNHYRRTKNTRILVPSWVLITALAAPVIRRLRPFFGRVNAMFLPTSTGVGVGRRSVKGHKTARPLVRITGGNIVITEPSRACKLGGGARWLWGPSWVLITTLAVNIINIQKLI